MSRKTGVTSGTVANLLLDGAIVKIAGTGIGATRGGVQISIARNWRYPEMDGQPGPVKGTARILSDEVTIKVSALEWTTTNIDIAIAGTSGVPGAGVIAEGMHKNVVIEAGASGGKTLTFTLSDALCTEVGLNVEDGNEGTIDMTFTGFYTAGSDAAPWSISVA